MLYPLTLKSSVKGHRVYSETGHLSPAQALPFQKAVSGDQQIKLQCLSGMAPGKTPKWLTSPNVTHQTLFSKIARQAHVTDKGLRI